MNWNAPCRTPAGDVRGELQAARLRIAADDVLEAGLVDRDFAALQTGDLGRVDVDADHVIADLGKAGARHQAHVSGTMNCDSHDAGSLNRWKDYRLDLRSCRDVMPTRDAGHQVRGALARAARISPPMPAGLPRRVPARASLHALGQ